MWWDCLSQNVQCHSLAVGNMCWGYPSQNVRFHLLPVSHSIGCVRLPFTKCPMSLTRCWSLKRCDETAFHKMCNICHSQTVGHRKRCWDCLSQMCIITHKLLAIGRDVMTAFHKISNVTHKLLVIGKHVKTAFHEMGNVTYILSAIVRERCDEAALHEMCNVTYSLLVIWMSWANCLSQNVQYHSLAVGHGKRCDAELDYI